jgi:RNA polymerase sigma factor (sigma-70 family)
MTGPAIFFVGRICYQAQVSAAEGDQRLVDAALGRDRGAQRELANRLLEPIQREVVGVLRRRAGVASRDPRQEVFDLSQDVLVALFEHDGRELRRWDPARGRNLESFVRLVARRRVARILSQGRGNPWAHQPVDPQTLEDDPAERELASQIEERDTLGHLLDKLAAHLGPRDLELFDLVFVQQRSPAEVTELLDMSRGAVNAWSYRIRKLARRLAEESGPNPVSSPAPPLTRVTAQS